MRIYIASPYTAETKEQQEINILVAKLIGQEAYKRGHEVYVPHLSITRNMPNEHADYDRIVKMHCGILETWAEAILINGHSKGVNIEQEIAERRRLTIFRTVKEIPIITP